MKGKWVISALMLLAFSQVACAQLKLFPAKGKQEILDTTRMAGKDSVAVAAADSVAAAPVFTPPSTVKVQLRLPLDGSAERKAGYMNFYEGFLLGVRQAASEGIQVDLEATECGAAAPRETDGFHLVVDAAPVQQLLRENRAGWTVVPLETETEQLCDSCQVALIPGSWQTRTAELARWIREDWKPWDKLFVLAPGTDPKTEFLKKALKDKGLSFTQLGNDYPHQNYESIRGTARFVLVAEDPGYTASVVNFLSGPVKLKKAETVFYCSSKVRSYARRFEEDALSNANTRMVSSYCVDYTEPQVDSFILDFRHYYGAEPNQFAFHGYDTALYFLRLASLYGEQWALGLEKDATPARGLLTDFRFRHENAGKGLVNTAFRRITYAADLSETVESVYAQ
jgi:hypothetical protein